MLSLQKRHFEINTFIIDIFLAIFLNFRLYFITFTCIYLADAFIQSDFQERALQKCIGH